MAALTKERDTRRRDGSDHSDPVAAGAKIYAGSLYALDAAGNAVSGSASTTLTARGRASETVDNTAGAAGDLSITGTSGEFRFANSGGDPITRADIGNNGFIEDDQTVAKTDAVGTLSVAGRIVDVDTGGVWVIIE